MFDATADIFADALRAEQTRLDAGKHIGGLPAKSGRPLGEAPTIAIPGSLTASSSVSTQQPRRTRQMAPATRSTLATCAQPLPKAIERPTRRGRSARTFHRHWRVALGQLQTDGLQVPTNVWPVDVPRKHDEARYDQFLEECARKRRCCHRKSAQKRANGSRRGYCCRTSWSSVQRAWSKRKTLLSRPR